MPRKKLSSQPEAARRRDGRHCPVCLAVLPRMAGQAGAARRCLQCGAQPSAGQRCRSCGREALWEAATEAACVSCGHHGSRVAVMAGHRWLAGSENE
jgi:hypothetical protein